jgi:hypothetical protein
LGRPQGPTWSGVPLAAGAQQPAIALTSACYPEPNRWLTGSYGARRGARHGRNMDLNYMGLCYDKRIFYPTEKSPVGNAAKAAASAGVLEKRRPGPRDWNRC